MAICKPSHHNSSFLIRHVHSTVSMNWLATAAQVTGLSALDYRRICLNETFGPTTMQPDNIIGILICIGWVNNCVMIFLLSILIIELVKMRKRAIRGHETLIQATAYIVTLVDAKFCLSKTTFSGLTLLLSGWQCCTATSTSLYMAGCLQHTGCRLSSSLKD